MRLFIAATVFVFFRSLALAAPIVVNSTLDAPDASPADGVCATAAGACTLRAAIQTANRNGGDQVITLPAGTYLITIAPGADDGATGDFNVGEFLLPAVNLTIEGAGVGSTIVDGNGLSAVFKVTSQPFRAQLTLHDMTVRNGHSSGAGCISVSSASLLLTRVAVSGCTGASGGGISAGGSMSALAFVTLVDTTIAQNVATSDGGGLWIFGHVFTSVSRSTIVGNSAGRAGGGIWVTIVGGLGSTLIANTTFSGNAADHGGAIKNEQDTATLVNVTIASDSSARGPAVEAFQLSARNTIIANLMGAGPANCSITGPLTDLGNNLEFPGTGCGFSSATDLRADPLLLPLASNGGPTQTHALRAGSPAVDAGDDAACAASPVSGVDQRGTARPSGAHCDIGAFEGAVTVPAPSPPTPPPPAPTAFPPTITTIPHQRMPPGASLTVNFLVSAAVDASRIVVGVSAYDPNLLPSSAFRLTRGAGANWSLTISAPNSPGTTTVQLMADDGFQAAGTAFLVTIDPGAPFPLPPSSPATASPSISPIPHQRMAPGSSLTLSFLVSGAIDASRIQVGVSAYDPILLPSSALRLTHGIGGQWSLTIAAPAGPGATIVQVMADDGVQTAGVAFTVVIDPAAALDATVPTAPSAVASGSGVALTWTPPAAGAPRRYAIAGGTAPGGSNLPVVLTADAASMYVIPALPSGTYYFRIHALFADSLGVASAESQVTVSNSPAIPGPPTGLQAAVSDGDITVTWMPPALGASPTLYQVEFGTAAGQRDVAIVTAVNPAHTRHVDPGTYWIRIRATAGAAVSGPSNDAAVPVAPGACTAPPTPPVLLPTSTTDGVVTFAWVPPSGRVDRYVVELTPAAGSPMTLPTNNAGSSLNWTATVGGGTARVSAINSCGSSAPSNQVAFNKQ
jgi:CSLREA domain-containing protein